MKGLIVEEARHKTHTHTHSLDSSLATTLFNVENDCCEVNHSFACIKNDFCPNSHSMNACLFIQILILFSSFFSRRSPSQTNNLSQMLDINKNSSSCCYFFGGSAHQILNAQNSLFFPFYSDRNASFSIYLNVYMKMKGCVLCINYI